MKVILKPTLFLLVAVLTLAGCEKNYYENGDQQSRRIIFSSRVTLEAQPRLQDLQIESGQELSLYITPNGNTGELLYNNVNIIANGSGGFTGETMYYPVDGRNIDLYAIHPYSATASLNTPIAFSISANQVNMKNYLNSDLLHATRINQPRTSDTVSLVFSHRLSKIDFTIESNDTGLNLSTLNTVQVLNTLPSTTINVVNGAITSATGEPVTINAYGVYGTPEVRASVSDIHAIVVPQTIPAGTQLFRVIIGQQAYVYTTTEQIIFQGGYQYNNKLTISAGQITLESSINPWEDGGSIGGGATPE